MARCGLERAGNIELRAEEASAVEDGELGRGTVAPVLPAVVLFSKVVCTQVPLQGAGLQCAAAQARQHILCRALTGEVQRADVRLRERGG